jgi:hypothetical protein
MSEVFSIDIIKKERFSKLFPFLGSDKRTIKRENIDTVILHWTASDNLDGTIKTLKNKNYGYHFLILKDGKIIQSAEIDRKLSHAGESYGPQGKFCNNYTIGVSFVTIGKPKGQPPIPFNNEQIEATVELLADLKTQLPNLKWITGHHWVSPRRKIDPYNFPFDEFLSKLNNKLKENKITSTPFKIWRTGDGIQGDPNKQDGLIKKGTQLSFNGNRYDRGYLTNEVEKYDELFAGINDVDDNLTDTPSDENKENQTNTGGTIVKITPPNETTRRNNLGNIITTI